ncbi:trigger factor [Candidatus Saccharibacteria bacterium]|nr:trigger factor [Candidatus Saccharibacteria bacterium]
MQIIRTNPDTYTALLKISAGAAELEPIRQHTLSHFAGDVKIPGFREGKAPAELVEKHVDQQRFMNSFVEHAVERLYSQALIKEQLRAVAPPQVQIKKFVPFTNLEFEAEVLHIKVTKLADYKKIKVKPVPVSVDSKDVEQVVKQLRQRAAERTAVERPAKAGDEIIIDFTGRDARGQLVPGAEGKDFPLILGSGAFIPGFEAELAGLKAGADKKFSLTFPKDYGVSALRGKKVTFEASVKKVNALYQTAADDAFAAKVSPFKSLADLKADIKKQLGQERELQARRELESQIIAQLIDKSTLNVPPQLIDEQVSRMEAEEKQQLVTRGQTWEEHLRVEGINEEQHRQRHRPDAERNIKAGILLGEIANAERIEATEEEVAIRTQILKGRETDPARQTELDKQEHQRNIRAQLLTEKTLAKLTEYATK